MDNTDQQLVELVRGGNARAYAQLVDRHKNRAMSLAIRLVGIREEAEELAQDAFVRAFRSIDQFRGDSSFGTWFYRILYNLCMTKVTRRKEKPGSIDAGENPLAEDLAGEEEPGIHEKLELEELRRIVSAEVDLLPSKLKSVVLLFYIQEMSYAEICSVTGLPLGSVKTYLHRGRNHLKKVLAAKLKDEVGA